MQALQPPDFEFEGLIDYTTPFPLFGEPTPPRDRKLKCLQVDTEFTDFLDTCSSNRREEESVTNTVANLLAPATTGHTSPPCWEMDGFVPPPFNSMVFMVVTRAEASK